MAQSLSTQVYNWVGMRLYHPVHLAFFVISLVQQFISVDCNFIALIKLRPAYFFIVLTSDVNHDNSYTVDMEVNNV